jgi:hypothetical protein
MGFKSFMKKKKRERKGKTEARGENEFELGTIFLTSLTISTFLITKKILSF